MGRAIAAGMNIRSVAHEKFEVCDELNMTQDTLLMMFIAVSALFCEA